MRVYALYLLVAFLSLYAFRDWFKALCGLILLTTLSQHPDMPHAVLGIGGLNPWNFLFFVIVIARIVAQNPSTGSLSPWFRAAVFGYIALIIAGGIRAMMDTEAMAARGAFPGQKALLFDLILNPLKYLAVGALFCDGCRTRRRAWLGVHTLLLLGLLHALMMYKTMKGMVFFGTYEDARRMTDKMIGLHANDLAGLLTFAFWATLVYAVLSRGKQRWIATAAAVLVLPAMVGCYSRAAFIANIGLALTLGFIRWRKLLIALPIGVVVMVLIFPRVATRLGMGFESDSAYASNETDWNEVTAGRTQNIWEPTVEQIAHSPLIGHGRLAILRTDCYQEILAREGNVPGHPHNSYLEILLDSGFIGLTAVVGLLLAVGKAAADMLRMRQDRLAMLCGGLGLVAIINVLVLGLASNFFYPKESMLWLICSMAIVIRARSSRPFLQVSAVPLTRRRVRQLTQTRNVPLKC